MMRAIFQAEAKKIKSKPWVQIPVTGPMLRPADAAAYLGISLSSYYALIQAGDLPPFVKLSNLARASAVPRGWLDSVLAERAAHLFEKKG